MQSLSFNQTTIKPIDRQDNQIWITSSDLALALGYKAVDSVTKIFNRNSDEFTSNMTQTVNLTVSGENKGLQRTTRIFSLRGCHLIAMFAKTELAKLFRRWVLDLLEQQSKQIPQMTEREYTHWQWHTQYYADTIGRDQVAMIQFLIRRWVEQKGIKSQTAYYTFNQYMRVAATDQVKRADFEKAMTWLHLKTGNINYGALDAKPNKAALSLPKPATAPHLSLNEDEAKSIKNVVMLFRDLNVLLFNLQRPLADIGYTHSAEFFDLRQIISMNCKNLNRLADLS